jgi:SAM-dependent methyltransferase
MHINKIRRFFFNIYSFSKIKRFFVRLIKNKYVYLLIGPNKPISNLYGLDRGKAVDRYYIGKFLLENAPLVKGRCLELLNNDYTKLYGGNKVIKSDILDINKNNTEANIIGDIKRLHTISENTYDCIILTQVLQFIDDFDAAIRECYRILKKGGVLLVTLPSISRIDCVARTEGDFWRFTCASARYIFEKVFSKKSLEIKSWGNAWVGAAFWVGLAQEDLAKKTFKYNDPDFPCLITVKAIK